MASKKLWKDWTWNVPKSKSTSEELVLVTGASGYIGSHVVGACLAKGYRVRGTVRKLDSNSAKTIKQMFPFVELAPANLTDDAGWKEALKDVTCVLHVASPYLHNASAQEFKDAAMGGAMRVLKFARAQPTVKRFALVSSVKAVRFTALASDPTTADPTITQYGAKDFSSEEVLFNAKDYYAWSKTISEKAAWIYISENRPDFDFCTVNPGAVWGPILAPWQAKGTSSGIIRKCLMGDLWYMPQMMEGMVDVRDVADVLCSCADKTKKIDGERFIVSGETCFMNDYYRDALQWFKKVGYNDLVWMTMPTFVISIIRICKPSLLKAWYPYLGCPFTYETKNTQQMLSAGKFRDVKKAAIDHAHSLLHFDEEKRTPEYMVWLKYAKIERAD